MLDNFGGGECRGKQSTGAFGLYDFFLEHKFRTRDDRRAVVALLRDESSGKRRKAMCSIIFEEGSAVVNGARGLLAGTMFFST